jgi:hypothetical protein
MPSSPVWLRVMPPLMRRAGQTHVESAQMAIEGKSWFQLAGDNLSCC